MTERELLRHLPAVPAYRGGKPLRNAGPEFASFDVLDAHMDSDAPLGCDPSQLLEGPVADALTHAGQFVLLRHRSCDLVHGEADILADTTGSRVWFDQAAPVQSF